MRLDQRVEVGAGLDGLDRLGAVGLDQRDPSRFRLPLGALLARGGRGLGVRRLCAEDHARDGCAQVPGQHPRGDGGHVRRAAFGPSAGRGALDGARRAEALGEVGSRPGLAGEARDRPRRVELGGKLAAALPAPRRRGSGERLDVDLAAGPRFRVGVAADPAQVCDDAAARRHLLARRRERHAGYLERPCGLARGAAQRVVGVGVREDAAHLLLGGRLGEPQRALDGQGRRRAVVCRPGDDHRVLQARQVRVDPRAREVGRHVLLDALRQLLGQSLEHRLELGVEALAGGGDGLGPRRLGGVFPPARCAFFAFIVLLAAQGLAIAFALGARLGGVCGRRFRLLGAPALPEHLAVSRERGVVAGLSRALRRLGLGRGFSGQVRPGRRLVGGACVLALLRCRGRDGRGGAFGFARGRHVPAGGGLCGRHCLGRLLVQARPRVRDVFKVSDRQVDLLGLVGSLGGLAPPEDRAREAAPGLLGLFRLEPARAIGVGGRGLDGLFDAAQRVRAGGGADDVVHLGRDELADELVARLALGAGDEDELRAAALLRRQEREHVRLVYVLVRHAVVVDHDDVDPHGGLLAQKPPHVGVGV